MEQKDNVVVVTQTQSSGISPYYIVLAVVLALILLVNIVTGTGVWLYSVYNAVGIGGKLLALVFYPLYLLMNVNMKPLNA